MSGYRAGRGGRRWPRGGVPLSPGHFDVHEGRPLPCSAPELKPLSVSHSGFASSGPLRRTPIAPPTLNLGCPLFGPWWGGGGHDSSRFTLAGGEFLGRISGCRRSRRARSARGKVTAPCADFLMPAAPSHGKISERAAIGK